MSDNLRWWGRSKSGIPDGRRSPGGHQYPPGRVGVPHEKDKDEDDNDEGKQYHDA